MGAALGAVRAAFDRPRERRRPSRPPRSRRPTTPSAKYQDIVAQGGWNTRARRAELCSSARRDAACRRCASACWSPATSTATPATGATFDSFVEAGVKRFQARHGLGPTGTVTMQTLKDLNVSAEVRLRQLQINIGAPALLFGRPRRPLRDGQHPGRLGRDRRERSGLLRTTPPASARSTASRRSCRPRRSTSTSTRSGRAGVDHQEGPDPEDAGGPELPRPTTRSASSTRTARRSRRPRSTGTPTRPPTTATARTPGADINSLGVVRININNPYGVYMHDTPDQGHVRRRLPLRLLGLRARAERARLRGLAAEGQSRLGPRPRSTRRSTRASASTSS